MTPEAVGAVIVAALAVLGTVAAAGFKAYGVAMQAWKTHVKPTLERTEKAAGVAAFELRNNHGSSTRDAVDRIEEIAKEMRRDISGLREDLREDISDVRATARAEGDKSDRAHAEIFRRLRALESLNPIEREQ